MQASNNVTNKEERLIKFMRLGGRQAEIARRLDVSRQYFNQWLNGKRHSKRLNRSFELLYRETTRRSKV